MMKKTKRLISVLLSLILCIQLLPVAVFAAETVASGTSGSAVWSLDANGTFTISGGNMENYASAAEQPWAEYAQQIKKVVIGDGVTRVGDHAFDGCSNLLGVEFGSDVYTIGNYAFAHTTALTEAKLPKNVTVLCEGLFFESGLLHLYVYNRKTEFDGYWNIEDSIPQDAVIHCYYNSHIDHYCGGQKTEIFTDDPVFRINNGNSSVALSADFPDYVRDLWSAADTADGMVFDYTLTMNNDDLIRIHNETAADNRQVGVDENNNSKLELEVQIELRREEGVGITSIRGSAEYDLCEYDLEFSPNRYYNKWGCWTSDNQDFLTITANGDNVTIDINATMQELEAYAGEPIGYIFIYIAAKGRTHYRSGRYEYDNFPTTADGAGLVIYDAHQRESMVEANQALTLDMQLEVEDFAPQQGNIPASEYAKFYEPVSRRYVWNYTFARGAHIYNEETDEYIYPGSCFWDLEGDGMATEMYNGILYGGVRGTYDAGSDSGVSIRQMVKPEELAFVETLRGLEPNGDGGEVQIELNYTLYVTFADGSEIALERGVADETSSIVGVCLHTCKVCGLCTSKDLLECNSWGGWRINECTCKTPSPAIVSSAVNHAQIVDSQVWCGDVTARVETFDVEMAVTTEYFKAITKNTGSHNVLAVYDITLYNGDGYPYTINEWGGTEEYVTLTIPVSAEVIAAAEEGLLEMYHVDKNGIVEPIAITVDAENSTITFTGYNFSPYILKKGGSTPGDIDGNETVDVDDVLALLWYVLFPDDYPIDAEADFDKNGSVDVDDVLTLLWYVLFPEDYPL